ncbi:hypothetical protein SYNPS1DRAFT_32199 [Syncephalis pseudoplumigaleata]|uniref:Uncharacterized protein n=1 Tax=Syncephalis pseudoplumigaleata TaxID=1712513 RepID=A0A4P9YTR8_9FUNG|nr:hypothetical protein SYNPS1DRAFT_32199 [Syncephalis pseudoplumigaleata]|eukprot:RKP22230.1 hypothetical protein SYNPS1DRAFT_32199 [Syncephalis pseudoplumigaleata]
MASAGSKFRTAIGKLRTPVEDAGGKASILLAYSGGAASRVLLELANDYNMANRSQRFAAYTICHVDESALFGDEQRKAAASSFLQGVRDVAAAFPFAFEEVPLESVFAADDDDAATTTTLLMTPMRHDPSSIFAESRSAIVS